MDLFFFFTPPDRSVPLRPRGMGRDETAIRRRGEGRRGEAAVAREAARISDKPLSTFPGTCRSPVPGSQERRRAWRLHFPAPLPIYRSPPPGVFLFARLGRFFSPGRNSRGEGRRVVSAGEKEGGFLLQEQCEPAQVPPPLTPLANPHEAESCPFQGAQEAQRLAWCSFARKQRGFLMGGCTGSEWA